MMGRQPEGKDTAEIRGIIPTTLASWVGGLPPQGPCWASAHPKLGEQLKLTLVRTLWKNRTKRRWCHLKLVGSRPQRGRYFKSEFKGRRRIISQIIRQAGGILSYL